MNNFKEGYMPRIRGRAYPIGKSFAFEVFITIGPETDDNHPIHMKFDKKKYISKDVAIQAMKLEIPKIIEQVCIGMKIPKPDGYLDLKQNKFTRTVE